MSAISAEEILPQSLNIDVGVQQILSSTGSCFPIEVTTGLRCGNYNSCRKLGLLACSKCHLVKYCCKNCQNQHWQDHRKDCKNSYLKTDWQPIWIKEKRPPEFMGKSFVPEFGFGSIPESVYLWGNTRGFDCLNLPVNEGQDGDTCDLKLCFSASGDFRNLIQTVNNLPGDYHRKLDVLLNDINPMVVNHNAVVLHTLLTAGQSHEQAAEVATHLMYSAAVSKSAIASLHKSANTMYGQPWQSFAFRYFDTRGRGHIALAYREKDLAPSLEMLFSSYTLSEALGSRDATVFSQAPSQMDYLDRDYTCLEPGHRAASMHFRKTGILAPFSHDTKEFVEPNCLLFSTDGKWIMKEAGDPLLGWAIPPVQASGKRHGVDPEDIYGCLFFHVKEQFAEFARRVEQFNINIYLTCSDAGNISQDISEGLIEPFGKSCFDRVETSNLADYLGPARVIEDWAPLLNRHNKHASLLMHSMNWYWNRENAEVADSKIKPSEDAYQHACDVMGITFLELQQELLAHGFTRSFTRAYMLVNIFASSDLGVAAAFEGFLSEEDVFGEANRQHVRMRSRNRIHAKQYGIPLGEELTATMELSKKEFYDTFCIGGTTSLVRFLEFEIC